MKAERARAGMTLEEVSAVIGVHANAVYRWENDLSEPTASNLIALCHLYDCSPEYLLGMVDDRNGRAVAKIAEITDSTLNDLAGIAGAR